MMIKSEVSNRLVIWVRPGKKNVLVLVIGRVDLDANKKKMRAAKFNKTPFSPVIHRRSTEFLTITKTCSFSNFNPQVKILLCHPWFTTIPGTWETFSQVALDIN